MDLLLQDMLIQKKQIDIGTNVLNLLEVIILLDKLSQVASNDSYDEKTKLRVSYSYLATASKAFEAMPCIKRYLFTNIQSRFLEITADEWDIAVMLPAENFVGATTSKVWSDSRKKF